MRHRATAVDSMSTRPKRSFARSDGCRVFGDSLGDEPAAAAVSMPRGWNFRANLGATAQPYREGSLPK